MQGKHGITYFADWGTILGTVRHGGYMCRWDDDMDICMKREDYIAV
ncbi:MAG: LicD family protein [Lachnospira sp.]